MKSSFARCSNGLALLSFSFVALLGCGSSSSGGGSGGTTGTGSGGTNATGTGGTLDGTGGKVSTGGVTSTGGVVSTGGVTSTGGVVGTGGVVVSTGGASTGGDVGTGSGGAAGSQVGSGGTPLGGGPGTGGKVSGGGMTGSMGGAGPIVAGGDSKCSGAPTIGKMCEGFEGTNSMTFSLSGGAKGVVDATKPYRGKMSAHMTTTSGNEMAFITEMATFDPAGTPAKNNEMWGRVFVWIDITGTPPISHTVFMTLEDPMNTATSVQFHLAGGSRGVLSAQIQEPNDKYKPAMVQSQAMAAPGSILYPFKPVQWQCWEWHTTAANTMDFWVDNKPYTLMSVTAADKWTFPTFKNFQVGFMQFGTTPAAELWVDEVAIDTARIGCDN